MKLFLQFFTGLSSLIGVQVQQQEFLVEPTACICSRGRTTRKEMPFIRQEITRSYAFRSNPAQETDYPHLYRGTDKIIFQSPGNPVCNTRGADLVEFPLTNPPFATTAQSKLAGAVRVIYLNNDQAFCGCIQHPITSNTTFVQCTYDLNP